MSQTIDYELYGRIRNFENHFKSFQVCDSKAVVYRKGATSTALNFDRIFNHLDSQKRVFEVVLKKKVDRLIQGESCIVFVYGAPNSGKNFTFFGSQDQECTCPRSPEPKEQQIALQNLLLLREKQRNEEKGMIQRSLQCLFQRWKNNIRSGECQIELSCIQINKNCIVDLSNGPIDGCCLHRQIQQKQLILQENSEGSYELSQLKINKVTSAKQIGRLLQHYRRQNTIKQGHVVLQVDLRHHSEDEPIEASMTFVSLGWLDICKYRQQEQLLLNSELYSLVEVLSRLKMVEQNKQLLRQSRLTKILRLALLRTTSVIMFGTMEIKSDTVNECLATMNFLKKTKNEDKLEIGQAQVELKLKLQRLLRDFENLQENHKHKMQEVQLALGLQPTSSKDLDNMTCKQSLKLNNILLATDRLKYYTKLRAEYDEQTSQLEQQLKQEIDTQNEKDIVYLEKKTVLEANLQTLNRQVQENDAREHILYKDSQGKYQKCLNLLNAQLKSEEEKVMRDMEKINIEYKQSKDRSEVSTYENQLKQQSNCRSADIQRQQRIEEIRRKFENEKMKLENEIKKMSRKDAMHDLKQKQFNRECVVLCTALEKQTQLIQELHKCNLVSSFRANTLKKQLDQEMLKKLKHTCAARGKLADGKQYVQAVKKMLKNQLIFEKVRAMRS